MANGLDALAGATVIYSNVLVLSVDLAANAEARHQQHTKVQ
jgi:hypothetical protein